MDLEQLRNGIDITDKQILRLFEERMELCRQVAQYKKEHGIQIFQKGREDEVIAKVRDNTSDENLKDGTTALFTTIIDISKHLQQREFLNTADNTEYPIADLSKAEKIGCQGSSGANSALAAEVLFSEKELIFCDTFEDVFEAVENGSIDYGIIPIYNSTAGSVTQAYDLMSKYNFYIVKSVCLEINHCLAAKPERKPGVITAVYSHPHALSQCSDFLATMNMNPVSFGNTATAAEAVAASSEPIAAICSEECANRLGLKILARGIANAYPNYTQFICISKKIEVLPNADTISVVLKLPNTAGSLYRLLTKFFVSGMNLEKLESRPVGNGSFEVMFYLDFKADIRNESVRSLLADLEQSLEFFKFLGAHSCND